MSEEISYIGEIQTSENEFCNLGIDTKIILSDSSEDRIEIDHIMINKNLLDYGFILGDNTPAFALFIKQNNIVIFKDVQGCARIGEDNSCALKATLDTSFPVLSLTKHFTAAAILMLEEEGRLSVDDDITRYLNLPEKFN